MAYRHQRSRCCPYSQRPPWSLPRFIQWSAIRVSRLRRLVASGVCAGIFRNREGGDPGRGEYCGDRRWGRTSRRTSSTPPVARSVVRLRALVVVMSLRHGTPVDLVGLPVAGPHRPEQSAGSGVILDPTGYIVTNNHVVEGATQITVTLSDRREFPAKIIGTDPKTDLAIIKIEAKDLASMKWADYEDLQVGDVVLAVQ